MLVQYCLFNNYAVGDWICESWVFCFVFEYFLQESDLSKNLTIIASVRESLEIILNQFISGKDVCWF